MTQKTKKQKTKKQKTKKQKTKKQKTKKPEAQKLETKKPEVQKPETKKTETKKSETKKMTTNKTPTEMFFSLYWPIIALIACVVLQLAFYIYSFHGSSLSSESADWSAFSTYFGLSFSVLSVLLVYMTYRSQTRMSAVLQFESIFFQWHQQHRAIYISRKSEIQTFSNDVVMKLLEKHSGEFSIETFLKDSDDSNQRAVMPYYRSLYHLMKYVHLSPILDNEDKRRMYIDIIQAQMTDEELNTVLYLLLADEWKNSTDVLGCSLMEMMDIYNLFKNFYYSKTEMNFEKFVDFMNKQFPNTKNLFHFLIPKETNPAE